MKLLLGLLVLLVAGMVFSHLAGYKRRLPALWEDFFASHLEFLLLGVVLGPFGLSLLNKEFLSALDPFLILGLGWVGVFLGLQLDPATLARLPRRLLGVSTFELLLSTVVIFGFLALAFWLAGQSSNLVLYLLGALSASLSAPLFMAPGLAARLRSRAQWQRLNGIAVLEDVAGVLFYGFLFSLLIRAHLLPFAVMDMVLWFVISLGIGIALAYLFSLLMTYRSSEEELTLYLLGLTILTTSVAQALGFSALFICFVLGIFLSRWLGVRRELIFRRLVSLERPIYIIFLLLVGAKWHLTASWVMVLLPVLVGLRMVAKSAGVQWGSQLFLRGEKTEKTEGLALVGQGSLTVAMVLGVLLIAELPGAVLLSNFILWALIGNELLKPVLLRATLLRSEADTGGS